MSKATEDAGRLDSLLSDQLGLDPKRAQFEKTMHHWCPGHWTFESDGGGGYHNHATELAWIAWQGATGTERERCDVHFSVVRELANGHSGRGDDCGVMARELLAALARLGA